MTVCQVTDAKKHRLLSGKRNHKSLDQSIQFFPVLNGAQPAFRNGGITVICPRDLPADCTDGIRVPAQIDCFDQRLFKIFRCLECPQCRLQGGNCPAGIVHLFPQRVCRSISGPLALQMFPADLRHLIQGLPDFSAGMGQIADLMDDPVAPIVPVEQQSGRKPHE